MKQCTECNKTELETRFYESVNVRCSHCHNELCKQRDKLRWANRDPSTLAKSARSRLRQRAKEKQLDFDLTSDDVKQMLAATPNCPVFGFEMVNGDAGPVGRNNSPSFDRIDSSKGYTKDNLQIMSKLANSMKQNATVDELKAFANWVLETYPQSNIYPRDPFPQTRGIPERASQGREIDRESTFNTIGNTVMIQDDVRHFILPPAWDIEYQVSKMDLFKQLGGKWDPEIQEWFIATDVDTTVIEDWLEAYEYGHHEPLNEDVM